jgi:phytoene dehydrogenase-like protein
VRYDAAIIGAGADGLAAATLLARKGLKTVVIERGDRPGGLLSTLEFHPGFRASPYADEIAAVPPNMHWALDLSRRGAIFVPAPCSLAVWQERRHVLSASAASPVASLLDKISGTRTNIVARAEQQAGRSQGGVFSSGRRHSVEPWPGQTWSAHSLHALLADALADEDAAAHLAALALCGRSADPFLRGSAFHALAPGSGCSGVVMGGLGRLADALVRAAEEAGVEIRCGLDASDLKLDNGRIAGVALVDGSEHEARAVISTLDLKRTFLSLFPWQALPRQLIARVGAFRMTGATARVLFALKQPPAFPSPQLLRGPIHVAPAFSRFAEANLAWRSGSIAAELPVTLRLVSQADPGLAPRGGAVMTATLGAVPCRLFDGAWTKEKRDILRDRALAAAELVFPGVTDRVVAAEVITPGDMDEALGATHGDLWGGEIAADQMLDLRPWADPPAPRTPIRGLYLAGPSSPLGPIATGAAGVLAAQAVMADFNVVPDR